jgi:membrane-associated phospholipid phosphatase
MRQFFSTLPRHIIRVFEGRNLLWNFLAIILTLVAVTSGFDWNYFLATRDSIFWYLAFPAVIMGGLLPIFLPLFLIIGGTAWQNARVRITGWALGQAAFIGWLVSSAYKSVSGRVPPELRGMGPDISHQFQFGFWNGGIFWGWPSSHTAVAFAVSLAFTTLYPKHRALGLVALIYALYIGLGVSVTIHWFSDFLAGAIIGSVIGIVVGKGFAKLVTRK